MEAKGFSQRELAETLGVPLDRVKNITSGRVKKLAPAESRALVEKLHVRGQYLATGEPPIFKSPAELELERRLAAISEATAVAGKVEDERARYAVQEQAFRAIVQSLTTDEQQLIQNYRLCAKDDQATVRSLAERLAQAASKR
jgi:transcriptional regulator with XRE-family HTH domain